MIHHLKIGDLAPPFELEDHNGKIISSSQLIGSPLVLFFYPKDDTPTCTIEACNLKSNYIKLKKKGYQLIGISPDDKKSHNKFKKKYALPFPLLCDTELKMCMDYGVYGDKLFFGKIIQGVHRTSFLIDGNFHINNIFFPVKSKSHGEDILTYIDQSK